MSHIILVIDFQKSFKTDSIEDDVRRIIKSADCPIVSLRFKNEKDSIFEKELDYKESMNPKSPGWIAKRSDKVINRFGYDGTRSEELLTYLSNNKVERCYIVGLETDACVLSTAMGLFDIGVQPVVIKDCCTTEASDDVEASAINVLERNIGNQNVVELDDTDLV